MNYRLSKLKERAAAFKSITGTRSRASVPIKGHVKRMLLKRESRWRQRVPAAARVSSKLGTKLPA
jgi:hypothetical protein